MPSGETSRACIPSGAKTRPAPAEIASWKSLPFSESEFLKKEVGSTELTGEPGRMVFERVWSRPTFEVHGIAGGFGDSFFIRCRQVVGKDIV